MSKGLVLLASFLLTISICSGCANRNSSEAKVQYNSNEYVKVIVKEASSGQKK